jgi:hypothetical protein
MNAVSSVGADTQFILERPWPGLGYALEGAYAGESGILTRCYYNRTSAFPMKPKAAVSGR